jgi:ATP-dependent RNA helicase DeaD
MTSNFYELGIHPDLVRAITELNFVEPTPIQEQAIPVLLEGRDVLGQAQTGTGKTAAFALPILQSLNYDLNTVQALILTPTRELAKQVADAVYSYGQHVGARILPIYGGQSYDRQKRRLKNGVDVVVSTPGRTIDLINQGALDLSSVRYLVIDEADEMLKMGFIDDVETIIGATDFTSRQTALFSATLSNPIRRLAEKYMHDPFHIEIKEKTMTVANTVQRYYVVRESDKLSALSRLLEVEHLQNVLVFARTRAGAAELSEALISRGYPAEALHGDLTQAARETVLRRFRSGQLTILVATDVVARGVDISDVSHVINYDIPDKAEDYVHRIGRTGRAGRSGDAITLITPRQKQRIQSIERFTRQNITKATLPTPDEIFARRDEIFVDQLSSVMADETFDPDHDVLEELIKSGYSSADIAAAAIRLLREDEARRPIDDIREITERDPRRRDKAKRSGPSEGGKSYPRVDGQEPGMVRLYLDVGREDGVRPGEIVGTIAALAKISGKSIGAIDIQQQGSFVDIRSDDVDAALRAVHNTKMRGKPVSLIRANGSTPLPNVSPRSGRGNRKSGTGKRTRKGRKGSRQEA